VQRQIYFVVILEVVSSLYLRQVGIVSPFLKAHPGDLSPAVSRQLKRDIFAEKKKREAEAKRSGERSTGHSSGRQRGTVVGGGGGGGTRGSQRVPPRTRRRQAQSKRVGLIRLGQFDGTCH
jgi:hypothetical protein